MRARRQDLLRALLRRRPGADLPHRPVRARPACSRAEDLRRVLVDAAKLQDEERQRHASSRPFYMPGKYWYAAMSWVHGNGGDDRQAGRRQVGRPRSPSRPRRQGLTKWADLAKKYSKGDTTKDENDQAGDLRPGPDRHDLRQRLGAGRGRRSSRRTRTTRTRRKVKHQGQGQGRRRRRCPSIPSFLGGSDLGVTAKSANTELAAQWIKIFTDSTSQEALIAKGALPNATALLDKAAAVKGSDGDRRGRQEQLVRADGAEVGGRREGATCCSRCWSTSPPVRSTVAGRRQGGRRADQQHLNAADS